MRDHVNQITKLSESI